MSRTSATTTRKQVAIRVTHSALAWLRGWPSALRRAPRGFLRHDDITHASALSFEAVLALVPLLALAVASMKGVGGYDHFSRNVVQPWLQHTFQPPADSEGAGVATLREAFLMLLKVVEDANLASLGAVGLVALLSLVWSLLRAVERSLNVIFGVRQSRALGRTLVDYAAIVFITPLCVVSATFLVAGAGVFSWLGPAINPALEVMSVLVAAAGLTFVYLVMPNARIPVRSALVGGLVSGGLGYAAFILQVHAQIGVARYNALYSGFAAIPLFLLWVFVSWLAILFGAEVAAAHSHPARYDWNLKPAEAPFAVREYVALRAFARLSEAYIEGQPAPVLDALSAELGVPNQLLEQVCEALVTEGILARAAANAGRSYLPARDIDGVRASCILEALRGTPNGARPAEGKDSTWELLDELRGRMSMPGPDPSGRELARLLGQDTERDGEPRQKAEEPES